MKVTVKNRKGKVLLQDFECNLVSDLQKELQKKSKIHVNRQRLTCTFRLKVVGQKVLQSGDQISKVGLTDGDEVMLKDLGPQISWRLVFFLEYLGPIFIHLIPYLYPHLFFNISGPFYYRLPQQLGLVLAVMHYLKRGLESLFVHRFSNATMPIMNLPKNCFHYWVLGGILISSTLYRPTFQPVYRFQDPSIVNGLLYVWIFAQLSNLWTHITLRNLRPSGSNVRKIPIGYGFNLVSCPNYFFEILGWICYSLLTGSLAAWFFTVVGAIQMYFWAVKKHQRYKKEFGNQYPKNRKVLVPFIL